MLGNLILRRELNIETWRIQGSLATAQARPDMMVVLKFLAEFKQAKANALARHLLFEERARLVVAQRLLAISEDLGLSQTDDGVYALTDKGLEALAAEVVFVPQDGCWELSVCRDELLPHIVVDVQPFKEPNAIAEMVGGNARQKREDRLQAMANIPEWVKACVAQELQPIRGKSKIRIDRIESTAERASYSGKLVLEWDVSAGVVRLMGREQKLLDQFQGPNVSDNDVWESLLSAKGVLEHWDAASARLAVPFEQVADADRMLMRSDIEFHIPQIQGVGAFDPVTVPGVKLRAVNEGDVRRWAKWRLDELITTYLTKDDYWALAGEALAPFAEYDISLPSRDEHALSYWSKSIELSAFQTDKRWHLIAAADWAL